MNNIELQKSAVVPFVEELSDLELEAISGGADSLISVDNNKVTVKDININVGVAALNNRSPFTQTAV